jgi:hypothetical protein
MEDIKQMIQKMTHLGENSTGPNTRQTDQGIDRQIYIKQNMKERKKKHTYKRSTNGKMERVLSLDNALMIMNRGYKLWMFANLK